MASSGKPHDRQGHTESEWIDAANMVKRPQTRKAPLCTRLSSNPRLYMNLCIVHMDTDNVVLCVTDPELDKEMHTSTEPGAIVSTTIKHLSTTMAELDSPWLPYRKHNFDGSKQKIWLLDRQSADCCETSPEMIFHIFSAVIQTGEKKDMSSNYILELWRCICGGLRQTVEWCGHNISQRWPLRDAIMIINRYSSFFIKPDQTQYETKPCPHRNSLPSCKLACNHRCCITILLSPLLVLTDIEPVPPLSSWLHPHLLKSSCASLSQPLHCLPTHLWAAEKFITATWQKQQTLPEQARENTHTHTVQDPYNHFTLQTANNYWDTICFSLTLLRFYENNNTMIKKIRWHSLTLTRTTITVIRLSNVHHTFN